jgi:hypothetical protein
MSTVRAVGFVALKINPMQDLVGELTRTSTRACVGVYVRFVRDATDTLFLLFSEGVPWVFSEFSERVSWGVRLTKLDTKRAHALDVASCLIPHPTDDRDRRIRRKQKPMQAVPYLCEN